MEILPDEVEIYGYTSRPAFYNRKGKELPCGFVYQFYRYDRVIKNNFGEPVIVYRMKPEMVEELEKDEKSVAQGKPTSDLLGSWQDRRRLNEEVAFDEH